MTTSWLASPSADERRRAAERLRGTALVGAGAACVCALAYAVVGASESAGATAIAAATYIALSMLVAASNVELVMLAINVVSVVGVVIVSRDLGGLTSPAMLWLPLLVRTGFMLLGLRVMLPSAAAMLLGIVGVIYLQGPPIVPPHVLDVLRGISLATAIIASLVGIASAERTSKQGYRLLAEANAVLAQAKDDAVAASRMKSEFVATVSHELRTPLGAIMGMNGMLLDALEDVTLREQARTARGSAQSLLQLVDDLLQVSQLEAGRVFLQPASCDVAHVVHGVRDMLALRALDKGLLLEARVPADLPRVVVDAGRLRQVVTNLVDNAVKFTSQGFVRIIVEHLPVVEDASRVRLLLVVDDTGIGIAPEKLEHIFERFCQADASTTRRFGGTGLGLAISRHLLHLMGGTLKVRSSPGAGTTFTAELDLPRAPPARVLTGMRVLLAEDNAVNQRLACHLFQSLGCSVDVADNGRVAVDLATARDYDAVFMDCYMPEMDGFHAAATIRARRGAALPIVALTAAGTTEDHDRAKQAGMNELLLKPIDAEGLRASLDRVLAPTPPPVPREL